MERTTLEGTFAIFSGLYGYYSLQRLLPMKLFNLEKLVSSTRFFGIKRLLLGLLANLLVAVSFVLALLWFNFLIDNQTITTLAEKFAAVSIIISSSALLLLPHRLIAFIAITFKSQLFENDKSFFLDCDFKNFLATPATSHLCGALFFLFYQLALGAMMKIIFL